MSSSGSDVGRPRSSSTADNTCKKCKKSVSNVINSVLCGRCNAVFHSRCATACKKCCGTALNNLEGSNVSDKVDSEVIDDKFISSLEMSKDNFVLMKLLLLQTYESNKLFMDKIKFLEDIIVNNEQTMEELKKLNEECNSKSVKPAVNKTQFLSEDIPMNRKTYSNAISSELNSASKQHNPTPMINTRQTDDVLRKDVTHQMQDPKEGNKMGESMSTGIRRHGRGNRFRKPIIGNISIDSESQLEFGCANRRKWIHVYKIQQGVSCETITKYLIEKLKINDPKCIQLTNKEDVCSFKVGVFEGDFDVLMVPSAWPKGVAVREFIVFRKSPYMGISGGSTNYTAAQNIQIEGAVK
ncbi:hypothetical protein ABEB36_009327 [Hypothenemus hampei]|uniref:Phorbol-ester/DAG-type domain-containing protein n=1 Tax=Hypothenemus hampei TaxID=57062 RepID=A0ABD1EGM4_HYPHA